MSVIKSVMNVDRNAGTCFTCKCTFAPTFVNVCTDFRVHIAL